MTARLRGFRVTVPGPRVAPPWWVLIAVPLISLTGALAATSLLLLGTSRDPVTVYREIIRTSFGSMFGLADTLATSTSLIFTGLAAAIAFRVQLWNIGAEGQLYAGAIATSGVAIAIGPRLPHAVYPFL